MVDRLNRGFADRSGHDLGLCDMLLSLALARSRVCRAVRRRIATRNERPGKRSLCSTLHGDGCRPLVFNLPHPNWAVWSSLTVIRPARAASLRRSGERLAGAVIGCALGLVVVRALNDAPMMLAVITVVVVVFMVAFEQYTLAVAVRSALAPLAAFALSGDALGAGEARFYCILIGVTIGTALMLLLSSQWVSNLSKRLVKKMRRSEVPAA
jgi:Fusaric acid resistance protein-like